MRVAIGPMVVGAAIVLSAVVSAPASGLVVSPAVSSPVVATAPVADLAVSDDRDTGVRTGELAGAATTRATQKPVVPSDEAGSGIEKLAASSQPATLVMTSERQPGHRSPVVTVRVVPTRPQAPVLDFDAAPAPTISGTAAVGSILTAHPGTWHPTPSSFTYQWYRSSNPIPSATQSTYTLTTLDKGPDAEVSVRVTARAHGITTATRVSAAIVVPLEFTVVPTPIVSGVAEAGQSVVVNHGSWSPSPSGYKYQWFRGSTSISGATGSSLSLPWSYIGSSVKVEVTASLAGYRTTSVYSPSVVVDVPPEPADRNCSDFATQAQAQAFFDKWYPYYGDFADLDADNDGKACETLP